MVEREELNKRCGKYCWNGKMFREAKEEDQGAVALVLDVAKAFERVSLPVVWAWVTHFGFPTKILRVLCGYFEQPEAEYSSKDAWRSRSRPFRPSCQGPSGVACFHVSYCRMR